MAWDIVLTLLLAGILTYAIYTKPSRAHSLPLPPSPKADPLIGHLRALPRSDEHLVYAQWGKDLNSDVVSISVLGQTIIILNSAKAANELLEQRSSIYSSRTQLPMVSDPSLIDCRITGLLPYGERWREQRRLTHISLHKKASVQFWPLVVNHVRLALRRIVDNPDGFMGEIKRMSGSTLLAAVYGYEVTSAHDPFLHLAETTMEHWGEAAIPGTNRTRFAVLLNILDCYIKISQQAQGIAPHSVLKGILAKLESKLGTGVEYSEQEDRIKWVVGTLFGGRFIPWSDFSVIKRDSQRDLILQSSATAFVFILAMVLNQSIFAKAQAEVDVVCVMKEVLRWQPVGPLGIPHAVIEDDEYRMENTQGFDYVALEIFGRAMSYDKLVYDEPEKFNPDRFLNLKLRPAYIWTIKDKDGNDVIPEVNMKTNVLVSYPRISSARLSEVGKSHQIVEYIDLRGIGVKRREITRHLFHHHRETRLTNVERDESELAAGRTAPQQQQQQYQQQQQQLGGFGGGLQPQATGSHSSDLADWIPATGIPAAARISSGTPASGTGFPGLQPQATGFPGQRPGFGQQPSGSHQSAAPPGTPAASAATTFLSASPALVPQATGWQGAGGGLSASPLAPQMTGFHDRAQHRFISGQVALEVFGQSGLSREDLAKIWTLADGDNRGKLNLAEFHVAMGLIFRRLNGNEIPDVLPPELVPASARDLGDQVGFLKDLLKNDTHTRATNAPTSRAPSVRSTTPVQLIAKTVLSTDTMTRTSCRHEAPTREPQGAGQGCRARPVRNDLDQEMDELKSEIRRVQDDLDYVSRGPRSVSKDEERRKLERKLLALMHERIPEVERKIEDRDRRRRDDDRDWARERDKRNQGGSYRDRDRDRTTMTVIVIVTDMTETANVNEIVIVTQTSDIFVDRMIGLAREGTRMSAPVRVITTIGIVRTPGTGSESARRLLPHARRVHLLLLQRASADSAPLTSTGCTATPTPHGETREERAARLKAETQAKIQARMKQLGVAGYGGSKEPSGPSAVEERLEAERKEAEEKAKAAEREAEEREAKRKARLEEARGGAPKPESPAPAPPKAAPAPPAPKAPGARGAPPPPPASRNKPAPAPVPAAPAPPPAAPAFDEEEDEELLKRQKALEERKKRLEALRKEEEELKRPKLNSKLDERRQICPSACTISCSRTARACSFCSPAPPPPAPAPPPPPAAPTPSSSLPPPSRTPTIVAPQASRGDYYNKPPKDDDDDWDVIRDKPQDDDSDSDEEFVSRHSRQKMAEQLFSGFYPADRRAPVPQEGVEGESQSEDRRVLRPHLLPLHLRPSAPKWKPPAATSSADPSDRGALFSAIQMGSRLRKTVTNDRSGVGLAGAVVGDSAPPSHINTQAAQREPSPPPAPAPDVTSPGSYDDTPQRPKADYRQSVDWYAGLAAEGLPAGAAVPQMPSMREEDEHEDASVPAIQVQAAVADDTMADVDTSVSHVVRSLYAYEGQRTEDLSFPDNLIIDAHPSKTGSDWWYGTTRKTAQKVAKAKALYAYEGSNADELPLVEGDVLSIVDKSEADWWKAEKDGMIFITKSPDEAHRVAFDHSGTDPRRLSVASGVDLEESSEDGYSSADEAGDVMMLHGTSNGSVKRRPAPKAPLRQRPSDDGPDASPREGGSPESMTHTNVTRHSDKVGKLVHRCLRLRAYRISIQTSASSNTCFSSATISSLPSATDSTKAAIKSFFGRGSDRDKPRATVTISAPVISAPISSTPERGSSPAFGMSWTSLVDKSVVNGIPDDERKRQEAIFELIATESAYVRDLQMIVEKFYASMVQMLDEKSATVIFANVEDILLCNTTFLSSLEERQKDCRLYIDHIGDILDAHMNGMAVYMPYCVHQAPAIKVLQGLRETNSELASHLQRLRDEDPDIRNLDLSSYLLIPMQRITRYPLLMKQASAVECYSSGLVLVTYQNGPSPHLTRNPTRISHAIQTTERILEGVNEAIREREGAERLVRSPKDCMSVKGTYHRAPRFFPLYLFFHTPF
ncbi:Pleckstrin homology domain, partial [Rhizoctonia solani]